jgi:hypothetical protein
MRRIRKHLSYPGNHTFGLACNERHGNISFPTTYVTAVVVGPG